MITLPLYLPSLMETDSTGWERSATLDKALACAFICIEAQRKKEKGFLFRQPEEAAKLIEVGFQLEDTIDDIHLYRKRK